MPASISQTYGGAPMRAVPDVAALGDPTTGMAVGQTQTFPDGVKYDEYRIGGTSLSSPLYAGMWALAVQKHGAYGLANPTLYTTRATSLDITTDQHNTYPGAVRVDYKNSVDADAGLHLHRSLVRHGRAADHPLRPGYDDVTGVGSPQGPAWLAAVSAG